MLGNPTRMTLYTLLEYELVLRQGKVPNSGNMLSYNPHKLPRSSTAELFHGKHVDLSAGETSLS